MIDRIRQALRSYARSTEEFCEAAGLRYFETHWGLEAHEIRRLAAWAKEYRRQVELARPALDIGGKK